MKKKWSTVTMWPFKPSESCKTTRLPSFTSARVFGALPVYTSVFQVYAFWLSHVAQILMPYFAGLFGMYCRKKNVLCTKSTVHQQKYFFPDCTFETNSRFIFRRCHASVLVYRALCDFHANDEHLMIMNEEIERFV